MPDGIDFLVWSASGTFGVSTVQGTQGITPTAQSAGGVILGLAQYGIGLDRLASGGATNGQALTFNGTAWVPGSAGSGTVTSVGLSLPSIFTLTGSPITGSGVLTATLASQAAGSVFAGPAGGSGAPTFRGLQTSDLPTGIPLANLEQGSATPGQVMAWSGAVWAPAAGGGTGTVTSVALALPSQFTVSGSPVTGSGTLTAVWASQTAHFVLAAPSGGAGTPTFRGLVASDIPALSYVTSVALAVPAGGELTISGSPVTSSGTLTLAWATGINHNTVFAGPTVGAGTPSFRALIAGDIPALSYVTSVGLSLPSIFTVSGSPVTSSGTLTAVLASQTAATVFAAPAGSAGAPSFRALVAGDLPAISQLVNGSNTLALSSIGHLVSTGTAPTVAASANAGTGASVSVVGNDSTGIVTLTYGTGPGSGGQIMGTVTFANAYTQTNQPSVVAGWATTGNSGRVDGVATGSSGSWTGIQLFITGTPTAGSTVKVAYQVMAY